MINSFHFLNLKLPVNFSNFKNLKLRIYFGLKHENLLILIISCLIFEMNSSIFIKILKLMKYFFVRILVNFAMTDSILNL